jgi:hypothetical protein
MPILWGKNMSTLRGLIVALALFLNSAVVQADVPKVAPVVAVMPLPPAPPPPPVPAPKVRAKPVGSPGDWINPDDYPRTAIEYEMAGVTGFRLFIDAVGKVSRCQVTSGSGFDVLDNAACERLTEHGKFTPARDGKGKAVPDMWVSRVVWRMPYTVPQPLREGTGIATLTINRMGVVTGCVVKVRVPDAETSQDQCWDTDEMPRTVGLELRGYGEADNVDRALQMRLGYELRSLLQFRFEIDAAGKMTQCRMERQKGSDKLVDDYCYRALKQVYEPVKGAAGEPTPVTGWIILRALRKLGA